MLASVAALRSRRCPWNPVVLRAWSGNKRLKEMCDFDFQDPRDFGTAIRVVVESRGDERANGLRQPRRAGIDVA